MNIRWIRSSFVVVGFLAALAAIETVWVEQSFGQHHRGYGMHSYGSGYEGGHHRGMGPDMSQEDYQKYQEKQHAFFSSTEDMRRSIFQKRLEMKSEFARKTPNEGKLRALQKEISSLRTEMATKRLDHNLEMRKLFPDAWFWGGMDRGRGRGHGHGMGYGRGMMGGGQGGCGGFGNCYR